MGGLLGGRGDLFESRDGGVPKAEWLPWTVSVVSRLQVFDVLHQTRFTRLLSLC